MRDRLDLGMVGTVVFGTLSAVGTAWAIDETGWCASAISNVAPQNVLVCDDFDDYCLTPPCTESSTTDNATFLLNWPSDGCLNENGSPSVARINAEQGGTNYGNSAPFTLIQTKGSAVYPNAAGYIFDGTSHHQSMVTRIEALDNTKGSVNGTDENPLVLDVYFDLPRPGASNYEAAQTNRYIELTDGSDRAPAELEIVTCPDGKLRPQLSAEAWIADRAAIAIGVFAVLDNDGVCDISASVPATYQPALYNGDQWYLLKAGAISDQDPVIPPADITLTRRKLRIILTVKSSTIIASYETQSGTSVVTAPRGTATANGFATIHVGNGACLPDEAFSHVDSLALYGGVLGPPIPTGACCLEDGECVPDATQAGCQGLLAGTYAGDGGDCEDANCLTPPGACCLADGGCIEVDRTTCESESGIFNGAGTTCAQTQCCPDPFADADGDGDVDMNDFAELQRCITTGTGGPVTAGCECFDVIAPFGTIDGSDLERFVLCGSGPEVVADACCDGGPGCQ